MKYCVTINNKRYEVEVEKGNAAIMSTKEIDLPDKQAAATTVTPKIIEEIKQPALAAEASGKEVVKAPIPGAIIDIKVSIGSVVKAGDTLMLLEAMKMENEITASVAGIIGEIKAQKGDNVSAGDVLVVIK